VPDPIRPIPPAPSLERDKKEAKALKKSVMEGEASALDRVRRRHPAFARASLERITEAGFSLRDAQLVIAREYGFDRWAEWKDFVASVSREPGRARYLLAHRAVERMDAPRLRELLTLDPVLATMRDVQHGLLIGATQSYANFAGDDPSLWSSVECAELLVDAGSPVPPDVYGRALTTAATPMVQMFVRKGVVPSNLRMAAAAGDLGRVRSCFDDTGELVAAGRPARELLDDEAQPHCPWPPPDDDVRVVADALRFASRHDHVAVAAFLLDKAIQREVGLGEHLDAWLGQDEVIDYLRERRESINTRERLTVRQLTHRLRLGEAFDENDGERYRRLLAEDPALLTAEHVDFQIDVLERCAYGCRPTIARALLDAGASVRADPGESRATIYAIDYGCQEMIELLRDLWPPPDDLPTAAGLGNLERVQSFFDTDGVLRHHRARAYPEDALTDAPAELLLHALGLAIMNEHLDVAELLLARGADIDGAWGLHEPASVLHEAAGHGLLDSVRFLVEHGADVNARDHRFGAVPHDWAHYMGRQEVHDYLRPLAIERSITSAAQFGTVDDVRRHVESGAEVNQELALFRTRGVTPLFLAVYQDAPDVVEHLLERGARPDHLDSNRRGAFHRIREGSVHGARIAAALAAAGADVTAASDEGITPLAHAQAAGLDAVAAVLLEYGAPDVSG
jgi:ankyrin repeat protein